jgi:lipase chaperone LimK
MPFLVCAFLVFVASIVPATAQTTMPASVSWEATRLPDVKPVQIALTPDLIEHFLTSLPEAISLARDLDREQGRTEPVKLDDDLSFLLVPYLFDPKIEAHINDMLAGFGFTNYSDWANVAHSLALVAEAANFSGDVDLGSQEQAARREIEEDAKLTPEEKVKALEELKSQFAALAEFEPLPRNRDIAAPYLNRLRKATGG